MTTSQTTPSFLVEVADDFAIIPKETFEYFEARYKSRMYNFIVGRFLEAEKTRKLTKAKLARRMVRNPSQITRWLASPRNWESETISSLMLAICKSEIKPTEIPLLHRPARNYRGTEWFESQSARGNNRPEDLEAQIAQKNEARAEGVLGHIREEMHGQGGALAPFPVAQ